MLTPAEVFLTPAELIARLTEGSPRQSAYSFSELRLIEALEAGALKINLCALGDCATGSLSESRVRAVEEMLS